MKNLFTFAAMKENSNDILEMAGVQQDADALRAKAKHYLVCFNDGCGHHAECLRWIVGLHVDDNEVAMIAVNPRCREVLSGECSLFRSCVKAVMKRGLTHFYDGMPSRQEHHVRRMLIARFNRKVYYQMRNGQLLIAPDEQRDIEAICRQCGWTGPFNYDGEEEDYVW